MMLPPYLIIIIIIIIINIYLLLRDRERQSMNMGGAERGGDTESEVGSRLHTVSTEPEPMNCEIMT